MYVWLRTATLALFAALFACGEIPLAPGAVTGTWALDMVDEQPLPAVVAHDSQNSVLFVSDTLRLEPDRIVSGRRCELRVDHVQESATTVCRPYTGTYTLRVRTLEIWYACQLDNSCQASIPMTGTLHGGRLVLTAGPPAPVLGYSRVD